MFLLKKIITAVIMPLPLSLLIILAGWLLLFSRKRARAGRMIIFAGVLILISFSYTAVADRLLHPLEYRYLPFSLDNGNLQKGAIPWIVVLSGGDMPVPGLPETSQVSAASLFRLAEAARLKRILPESRVVISGGAVYGPKPEAEVIAGVAPLFGMKPEDLALEANSRDTEEQAKNISGIVGKDKCILVTSAWHMPRAVALFRKAGLDPVPAPVGHLTNTEKPAKLNPGIFFPNINALSKSEIAVHEYIGMAWSKSRGLA
jgi:uncharacterized SAM-binding protein YcdF (DUF218 family)